MRIGLIFASSSLFPSTIPYRFPFSNGILFTSRFCVIRCSLSQKTALLRAVHSSFLSIMILYCSNADFASIGAASISVGLPVSLFVHKKGEKILRSSARSFGIGTLTLFTPKNFIYTIFGISFIISTNKIPIGSIRTNLVNIIPPFLQSVKR